MYAPYLRGKQFELLAIKEMAGDLARSGRVRPVIEPVREPNGALLRCLQELSRADVDHTVVLNPTVGDLRDDATAAMRIIDLVRNAHAGARPSALGLILAPEAEAGRAMQAARSAGLQDWNVDLIHQSPLAENDHFMTFAGSQRFRLHLVDEKSRLRRYKTVFRGASAVKLSDPFQARDTNLAYVDQTESYFSDEYLYFEEDGFVGFSDYLTIGRRFTDGGSLPRAVVIHLSHISPDDNAVYVRHFSSDSNSDTSDPARKFGEAVAKLIEFVDLSGISNPAVEAFRSYFEAQAFPGLGMIKKLSMQNHLYVMMAALEK